MNATEILTNFPLQISFRNLTASPAIELWVRLEAAKLETFYKRIMGCRVAIEKSQHHVNGSPYLVRIDLTVPGGELVVNHHPAPENEARRTEEAKIRKHMEVRNSNKQLRQAIKEAFTTAGRQLQDYSRRQRGNTKNHAASPAIARVSQLFPEKGYGFLMTSEGNEVYFHKSSVIDGAFNRLKLGSPVSFAEEQGDKGLQASSVKIEGKHRMRHVGATA